uniref:Uncharacterized protein n=1 Tax=Ananas comosus var. bracteatus TaxID=296719 RepID=A0A6V7NZH0_ANACO|nr:unnamed protein product [Ananas comosus var. bracteatus]
MGALTVTLTLTLTLTRHPPPPPLTSSSFLPPNRLLFLLPRRSSSAAALVGGGGGMIRVAAYMERNPNSAGAIASKLIGALPVVGLLARIFADEGGVGDDIVDFAEFRRRVGKKCGVTDSQAFYEFRDRRGRVRRRSVVCSLMLLVGCRRCWLLKSEEIFEGVARLRISNDIEFEEETFLAMMNAAKEKRANLKSPPPEIPMEIRAEKALEGIYVCCFGQDPIEEEDAKLLCTILNAVFLSVGRPKIGRIVSSMAQQIASGERKSYPGQKTLSKEAVERQMKDLEFLQQKRENSI